MRQFLCVIAMLVLMPLISGTCLFGQKEEAKEETVHDRTPRLRIK